MPGGVRRWWLLLACALVGACASAAPARPSLSSPSPLLGRALPAFARRALDGQAVDTTALRGQVVIVKFFAEYCEPCRRSLPALEVFHREHPGVAVVGLSLDEDPEAALAQVARYRLSFPVIHDRDRVLGGRFRVGEMPVAFVVDRAGRLVWVGGPEKSHAELAGAAEATW